MPLKKKSSLLRSYNGYKPTPSFFSSMSLIVAARSSRPSITQNPQVRWFSTHIPHKDMQQVKSHPSCFSSAEEQLCACTCDGFIALPPGQRETKMHMLMVEATVRCTFSYYWESTKQEVSLQALWALQPLFKIKCWCYLSLLKASTASTYFCLSQFNQLIF